MKRIILISTCLFAAFGLRAQQLPLFSQYMFSDFFYNPAIAGTQAYSPFRSLIRNQWTGIAGAPNTQGLSFHTAIGDKPMGLGGYVFSDQIGPLTKTGLSASYAYHVKCTAKTHLSLGVSAMLYSVRINSSKLLFDDAGNTDNALVAGNLKAWYPNFSFGAYYYGDDFFAGISVPELMQTKVSSSSDFTVIQEVRHYYISGGYTYHLNKDYTLQPSFLVKYVPTAPGEVDLNLLFEAFKKFSVGLSYRSGDAIVPMVGFRYKEVYRIGYAYDITTSHLSSYAKGSHEIMLGYDLVHKAKSQPQIN
jgi:type IX secretion system PorP/SprF family membrane protein